MEKKCLFFVFILFHCVALLSAQETETPTIVDWRQHNLTKYNRMLVNPAYSIVREDRRAISFWSRIQWTGVNNSPQTFLLNYSGKVGESSGAGLGLYQQNLGLLTDSGMLMNYAYSVRFSSKASLTLGLNSALFRRGLNKNAVSSSEPDPAILENQDDFLWVFMPGINLSYGGLDLGVYAENLFDYNLNESRSVTAFDHKIYSAQMGYTHVFKYAVGVLRDAQWRTLSYVKTLPNNQTQFGGSSLLDLPRYGWLQAGYNNVYGINGALGVKLGDGISVGVIFESGTNLSNRNFGPTYEAMATVELGFGSNKNKVRTLASQTEKQDTEESQGDAAGQNRVNPAEKIKEVHAAVQPSQERVYAVYGGEAKDKKGLAGALTEDEGQPQKKGEEIASIEKEEQQPDLQQIIQEVSEEEIPEVTAYAVSATHESPMEPELTREVMQHIMEPEIVSEPADELAAGNSGETTASLPEMAGLTKADANIPEEAVVTREVFGETSSYKTIKSAAGVDKGFYLVVNVFSREHYFRDFTRELQSKGFEPHYFKNPDNDFWYVYLAYADNYYRVKQMQRSHLEGQYRQDKWVLWVK